MKKLMNLSNLLFAGWYVEDETAEFAEKKEDISLMRRFQNSRWFWNIPSG